MKKLFLILLLGPFSPLSSSAQVSPFLVSESATQLVMSNLKISAESLPVVELQETQTQGASELVRIHLRFEGMPVIQLKLRGPQGFLQRSDRSLRTLFLATGFFTGSDSTLLMGEMADTVFVGFDYPFLLAEIAKDPAKLLQTFRLTPGQMALSLKWLSQQAWVQPEQMVAMGVSLGGLFLPAALHIAQKINIRVGHVVFAFTGVDTKTILQNNLQAVLPVEVLPFLLMAIPTINTLNEPELHLPYLRGSFLVIYTDADQIIPRGTSERLFALLPNPKDQVILSGPHIDINRPDLLQKTKDAVLAWLQ